MALSVFPARRSHPTELGVSEPQREPPRPSHIFSSENAGLAASWQKARCRSGMSSRVHPRSPHSGPRLAGRGRVLVHHTVGRARGTLQ
jgi:hypothetical protein